MIDIKVNLEDGDCFYTGINLTFEEAKKYYVGYPFDVGLGPEDNKKVCTSIEYLGERSKS